MDEDKCQAKIKKLKRRQTMDAEQKPKKKKQRNAENLNDGENSPVKTVSFVSSSQSVQGKI
jgi:hypothetical protein